MESAKSFTLSEEQIVVERATTFPVSFETALADPDDDGSGENSNQTDDKN
jgi:hypothetical protein